MLMLERHDELNRLLVDFAREVTGRDPGARPCTSPAEAVVPGSPVELPISGVRVGHWTARAPA